jgi:outer membrane biosynthesis protein TonB
MKRLALLSLLAVACSHKKEPKTIVVKPDQLHRTAGTAELPPDADTAKAMLASGRSKVITSWKVCVSPDGAVDEASPIRSSGFVTWDAALAAGIKAWRFTPLTSDGEPARACTSYTFAWSAS